MVKLAVGKKLGRPCAVDAGETRKRLLAEARRSFATVGFEATTNRSIAAAAGITTGAIYHYFPSKLEMYVAAFAEVQDLVHDAFETAAAKHETFAAKFSAILDAIAELGAKDPSLASFVVGVSSKRSVTPICLMRLSRCGLRARRFCTRCAQMQLNAARLWKALMQLFCTTSSTW